MKTITFCLRSVTVVFPAGVGKDIQVRGRVVIAGHLEHVHIWVIGEDEFHAQKQNSTESF